MRLDTLLPSPRHILLPALSLVLAACGGKVFVDGNGGAGGQGGTGAASSGSTSASSGPAGCTAHTDCPGGLCVFATGACADACDAESCDPCTAGTVCEQCATSACHACNDCKAACLPTQPGRCDDDDPCPPGGVCLFDQKTCAPACSFDGDCGDFAFCDFCATGSCCGCENCVSACIGGE